MLQVDTTHRWSEGNGRWCLDCGTEDITEHCLVNHKTRCCSNFMCRYKGANKYNPDVKISPNYWETSKERFKEKKEIDEE